MSVAQSLVERQFVVFKNHKYMIQRPRGSAGDVAAPAAAAADDDDDDDSAREQSIVVSNVPPDLVEEVLCLLWSERKRGGAIERHSRDNCTGTTLFTFVSKDGQCVFYSCTSRQQESVCFSVLSSLFSSFLPFTHSLFPSP